MDSKTAGSRLEQRALLRDEQAPGNATIVVRAVVTRGPSCAATSIEPHELGRSTVDRCLASRSLRYSTRHLRNCCGNALPIFGVSIC